MSHAWTLKKRLALTFMVILGISALLISVAVVNTGKLLDTVGWNTHTYKVMQESDNMLINMINIETGMRGFVASGEEKFLEPYTQGQKGFGAAFDAAKQLTSDNPSQQTRLDAMMSQHKAFMAVADSLLAERRAVTAGKQAMDDLLRDFGAGRDKTAMDAFRGSVAEFKKAESDLLVVRSAALASTASLTTYTLVLGGLALCGLTMALGYALTRSVFHQLGAEPSVAVDAVNAVARGDLAVRIDTQSHDSTSLMAALAGMRDSLSRVVTDVRSNADGVATASAQIAQGNQDLSSRTEEQASALQQTAATMEELGTTVRNNADSAKQANQLAQGASSVAAKGGEVVGQVVATMQGISDSSRKIGDIISVIDGIAFQTNILALNAAVEAARAGEQGRGFAVVASEVRSLAQRSAEAAKEIKALIGRSVQQVEQGTELVGQAGLTMGEIVVSIQRVRDMVAEISSASAEQSNGVMQVSDAVGQMDQATQQNAALVEESAAAAESLKTQAQHLVQAVAVFKLASQGGMEHAGYTETRAAASSEPRRAPARAKPAARAGLKPRKPASAPAPIEPVQLATAEASGEAWASF